MAVVEDSSVSAILAEENLDPNTTNPIHKGKHLVPAIRAICGEAEGPSKEKKILRGGRDCVSKKSTTGVQHSHSFQNSWTFWFDNPFSKSKQASWGSSLRSLYTFATIEEFWGLYNNMHPPTKWVPGADLYCFKHGIEPKWEDPICANGGKWTMMFPKAKLESNWLNTLLALVGEQFEKGDEICGTVLNFRARGDKISLWTKNAANEEAQLSIGKQWKELLGYTETIGFIVHEDAKTLDRDAKRRYTTFEFWIRKEQLENKKKQQRKLKKEVEEAQETDRRSYNLSSMADGGEDPQEAQRKSHETDSRSIEETKGRVNPSESERRFDRRRETESRSRLQTKEKEDWGLRINETGQILERRESGARIQENLQRQRLRDVGRSHETEPTRYWQHQNRDRWLDRKGGDSRRRFYERSPYWRETESESRSYERNPYRRWSESDLRFNERSPDWRWSESESRSYERNPYWRWSESEARFNERRSDWRWTESKRGFDEITHRGYKCESSSAHLAQTSKKDCWYYLQTGTCRYGTNCCYNHPTSYTEPQAGTMNWRASESERRYNERTQMRYETESAGFRPEKRARTIPYSPESDLRERLEDLEEMENRRVYDQENLQEQRPRERSEHTSQLIDGIPQGSWRANKEQREKQRRESQYNPQEQRQRLSFGRREAQYKPQEPYSDERQWREAQYKAHEAYSEEARYKPQEPYSDESQEREGRHKPREPYRQEARYKPQEPNSDESQDREARYKPREPYSEEARYKPQKPNSDESQDREARYKPQEPYSEEAWYKPQEPNSDESQDREARYKPREPYSEEARYKPQKPNSDESQDREARYKPQEPYSEEAWYKPQEPNSDESQDREARYKPQEPYSEEAWYKPQEPNSDESQDREARYKPWEPYSEEARYKPQEPNSDES